MVLKKYTFQSTEAHFIVLTCATSLLIASSFMINPPAKGQQQPPAAEEQKLLAMTGKITFLRVNDVGTGYGPASDNIDAEAIVKLDTAPDRAFGLTLRNDESFASHQKMFEITQDAFDNDRVISIDFLSTPPQKNEIIVGATITK
jgi:hypothetical protein